jgi:transposase InsO family protein
VRYQFIKEQQEFFSLSALCRAMQVCRGGFYAWRKRPKSERQIQDETLTEQIKTVYQESKETYGSPRICADLKEAGISCSPKRIARLMRLSKISALRPKRFVVTTDSDHKMPIAENLLDRTFEVQTPDTRWTADITYLWTGQGWLYLAVILDLFSRRIVGWAMDQTIDRTLVLSALNMALLGRKPGSDLLCHSDRGSQYASDDYQKRLKEVGIVCSMSRRGNCWDNAPTESFFAGLKKEMVYRTRFETREQARSAVFSWIEVWYNRKRRHSTLGYLSPEAFERKHQQQQAAAIAAQASSPSEPSRDGSGVLHAAAS